MNRLTILLFVVLFSTSCSIFRKVDKSKHEDVSKSQVSDVTKSHTEDKTVTTVTETAKGDVEVPGTKISGEGIGPKITTVVNGDSLLASYDAKTNKIKTQFIGSSKKVPVNVNKTTEIKNDIKSDVEQKKDSSGTKKNLDVNKHVEAKSNSTLFWIIIIVISAGVIFLAVKYGKPLIKKWLL